MDARARRFLAQLLATARTGDYDGGYCFSHWMSPHKISLNIVFHADSRVSLRVTVQTPGPGTTVRWQVLSTQGAVLSYGPNGEVCE